MLAEEDSFDLISAMNDILIIGVEDIGTHQERHAVIVVTMHESLSRNLKNCQTDIVKIDDGILMSEKVVGFFLVGSLSKCWFGRGEDEVPDIHQGSVIKFSA